MLGSGIGRWSSPVTRSSKKWRMPSLPGATSNHCLFCWHVLTRGLAAGVSGGGGQIGDWTGTRPNFAGELIQIGVRQQ